MACEDPVVIKCAGTQTASVAGIMVLSEPFLQPFVVGDQGVSLVSHSP